MTIDAIACERQFLDHMAPVWRLLPPQHRGRLLTDAGLVDHARALGVDAESVDANALRRSSPPPAAIVGDGPAAFVVSIGDTKVARRLGYRRFAFMEHGAGQAYIGDRDVVTQRHPSYAGGVDRDDVGLFLVPNEYSAALWRRAYPAARVELVGCPKLEDLPTRELWTDDFIGLESEAWRLFDAAIQQRLTTSGSTDQAVTVCAAHAIADARVTEPGDASSPATSRKPSTTDSDTSLVALRPPRDQPDLVERSTAAVLSATSECTSSCAASSPLSVISAERLRAILRSRSVGIRLRTPGSSTSGPATPSLEILTTSSGSVSLAIPSTTARAVTTALEVRRPVVAVSWHWPGFTCPEADTALGHYLGALPGLAAAFPGRVIGHAHPKGDWPKRVERYYRRAGIPFVADFADVCRQADVYVCDNSSTIYEFAVTGRPVVVLNRPEYRRNVQHGGRFWTWSTIGVQVDHPSALVDAIALALEDPPDVAAERDRVLELVYPVRAGAARRAAASIADWLTVPATVAA